ncbi:MAG: Stk1 family PASTA domain-containing Ser/Thr kinase [Lachnospiraceae bacterium]|nr:Stk1 family PASTA domain-containing Ser/Thr kinase [Lachnospiraceae bacterium]MBO4461761.1 Stk1 family PASTA domain-containing Ser/Thr kinase [Lachnospiraceae bacterium]
MLEAGTMLAGRYKILNKIGAGGMSDVYKAIDTLIERDVAIKVLKPEYSEDVNFLTKFHTEAKAAGVLQNPNIVNVYDVGSENKLHYIVMEYVEGITLKTYIEKCERISVKESLAIAIQVANGIRAAHNKGIIHRDIKPQNIMVSIDGKAKVTDFGIARATTSNTISSDVMGSVHYTSPEQARNGFVDAKSDIYSFGIVMYEMVTGRVPFDGDSAVSVALQHLQEEIIRPSAYVDDLPISLEKIILKCTQKSPDRRYHSMDELLEDLKRAAKNPDEDFVVIDPAPAVSNVTRVISKEEVDKINEIAGTTEDTVSAPKAKDMRKVFDDDDDDDDDSKPLLSPKWEKIVTIGGIAVAAALIILIILIVGTIMDWFSVSKGPGKNDPNPVVDDADKIEMINIVGFTFDEAQRLLNEMGLGIQITAAETSEEYEEGQIMSQSVEKGEMVEKNTTIKVVVCAGTEGFQLPKVSNLMQEEATKLLMSSPYYLVVSVTYEYSSTVEAMRVISVNPREGSTVHSGDSITLVISRGPESVEVPDVTNMTESEARAALTAAGFSVTVTSEYSDQVEAGRVISQSIAGGKTAAPASTIKIIVSLGPESHLYKYKGSLSAAQDIIKDGYTYHAVKAYIEIYSGDDLVFAEEITSFPYEIDLSDLPEELGTVKIVWVYANESNSSDTFIQEEQRSITFSAQ